MEKKKKKKKKKIVSGTQQTASAPQKKHMKNDTCNVKYCNKALVTTYPCSFCEPKVIMDLEIFTINKLKFYVQAFTNLCLLNVWMKLHIDSWSDARHFYSVLLNDRTASTQ